MPTQHWWIRGFGPFYFILIFISVMRKLSIAPATLLFGNRIDLDHSLLSAYATDRASGDTLPDYSTPPNITWKCWTLHRSV